MLHSLLLQWQYCTWPPHQQSFNYKVSRICSNSLQGREKTQLPPLSNILHQLPDERVQMYFIAMSQLLFLNLRNLWKAEILPPNLWMQENVPLTSGDELGALLIDNIPVRGLLLNFCPSPSACNGSFVYWSLRLHTHGHIEFLFYGLVLCWLCRELSIENPLYKASSDVFYGDSVYSGNLTYSVYTNSCINKAIEREREREWE